MPKEIKNILAVRNDRFGEFLLNIPALRALKETFPAARLIVAVNPGVKELAENIPFVDEVLAWPQEQRSLPAKVFLLRRKNIDLAVMLNPSKEFNILTFLAGIPLRLGYGRKWGFLLTHKIKDKKYLAEKHEVEYNLELVSAVGARTKDKSLSIRVDESIAKKLFGDFNLWDSGHMICLHPWTSDPVKQWPLENFLELAKRLSAYPALKVIIVGGSENSQKSRELFGNTGKNLLNLTAKTTLTELAALLKSCKLLISGDSGPVHLAACVGTPVIALFRNDIPGKTAKRWGPWGKGNTVIEKELLRAISVEEVFNKAREHCG